MNSSYQLHDVPYYLKCMIAGMFTCGVHNTLLVPLNMISLKKQLDSSIKMTDKDLFMKLKSQGELTLGWLPTLIGYSIHGFIKFGFY